MSRRALRPWATLFLAALAACPATMAGAATPSHDPAATAGVQAAAARHPATRHRRSRARRAPPGGVVWARNAIVVDPATGEVLYQKNSAAAEPCASLTKMMTALVLLEQKPDMDRVVEVTQGGRTYYRALVNNGRDRSPTWITVDENGRTVRDFDVRR